MTSQPPKGEPIAAPTSASSSAAATATLTAAAEAGTRTPKPASGDGSVDRDVPEGAEEDWESERKLVSSLWLLQQMEAKVRVCLLAADLLVVWKPVFSSRMDRICRDTHSRFTPLSHHLQIYQLRTLVPDRLLAPLAPIVNPDMAGPSMPMPKSPQEMFEQLSQAARDGVVEVNAFKAEWNRPEMKIIWDRIDQKLAESGGDYPQPTGMWEQNYDDILKNLDRDEKRQEQQQQKVIEEQELSQLISADGGWRGVVESFMMQDNPGLLVTFPPSVESPDYFFVLLRKISAVFCIQPERITGDEREISWQVKSVPHGSTSKLEIDILNHISTRDRQWDLRYLLVSSVLKYRLNIQLSPHRIYLENLNN
jgi:hypothetical protein